jgi:ABC-type sugar transport system ATPase subunit
MPGEVHALMGENGAGKSTLMKVLGGIHQPDSGRIIVSETPVKMSSPLEAKHKGIVFIHQELSLAKELTVAENIYLGELPCKRFGLVDWQSPLRQDQHDPAASQGGFRCPDPGRGPVNCQPADGGDCAGADP